MYNLRIKVEDQMFYNVELGNAYLKASTLTSGLNSSMTPEFKQLISKIIQKEGFTPNISLFKGGKATMDSYIDFNEIMKDLNTPAEEVQCWIMNNTGDTIETFTVYNIAEDEDYPDDDDFKAITLED